MSITGKKPSEFSPQTISALKTILPNYIVVTIDEFKALVAALQLDLSVRYQIKESKYIMVPISDCLFLNESLPQAISRQSNYGYLSLVFTEDPSTFIGGAANSLSSWNTFFDLPTNGTVFNEITYQVTTFTVSLFGGSNIHLADSIFNNCTILKSIIDNIMCITSIGLGVFYYITFENVSLSGVTDVGYMAFSNCIFNKSTSFLSLLTASELCFNNSQFNGDVSFPSLVSASEWCFNNSHFVGDVSFPSLVSAGDSCFYNSHFVGDVSFPSLVSASEFCFYNSHFVGDVSFPSLVSAGDRCFYLTYFDRDVSFSALEAIDDYVFAESLFQGAASFPNVLTVGEGCFNYCLFDGDVSLPVALSLGYQCFWGSIFRGAISLPALTAAGDACFSSATFSGAISLPALITVGTTAGSNGVFSGIDSQTFTLTIPLASMSDDDIAVLITDNDVTVINT